MTDLQGLIEKHRSNGLLIDTNLLLFYVAGRTNKNRIPNFKRTQKYTIEDFELLTDLSRQFRVRQIWKFTWSWIITIRTKVPPYDAGSTPERGGGFNSTSPPPAVPG